MYVNKTEHALLLLLLQKKKNESDGTGAQVGSRICLSASEFHQDSWQPSWTVTSLVTALVAHMTEPAVEIGSVRGATRTQKRRAAARSRGFECALCGCRHASFPEGRFPTPEGFEEAVKDKDAPRPRDAGGSGSGGSVRVDGGRAGGPSGGGGKGVAAGAGGRVGGAAAVRAREGLLSRTMRLLRDKSFLKSLLLTLALIYASAFLYQSPSR